jgi:hypothetical protein
MLVITYNMERQNSYDYYIMNSHPCHLESLRHRVSHTRSRYVHTKSPHFTAPLHLYSHNPPRHLSFEVARAHVESWRNKGGLHKALVFIVVVPPDDHPFS